MSLLGPSRFCVPITLSTSAATTTSMKIRMMLSTRLLGKGRLLWLAEKIGVRGQGTVFRTPMPS